MKISSKGRYALRLLIDIAENERAGRVSIRDVAGRQEISIKYLEQIVPHLTKAKLLRSARGAQGGYSLAKPPEQYTAGEILRAVEGDLSPVACLADGKNLCERAQDCRTLGFWTGLHQAIQAYVDGVTLRDLMQPSPAEKKRSEAMYLLD